MYLWSSYLCMCVACVLAHAGMCGGGEAVISCLPLPPPDVLRGLNILNLEPTDPTAQLAPGILPSLPHSWEAELRSPCLPSKHFADPSISLAIEFTV